MKVVSLFDQELIKLIFYFDTAKEEVENLPYN